MLHIGRIELKGDERLSVASLLTQHSGFDNYLIVCYSEKIQVQVNDIGLCHGCLRSLSA